jgi:hypothetical protein
MVSKKSSSRHTLKETIPFPMLQIALQVCFHPHLTHILPRPHKSSSDNGKDWLAKIGMLDWLTFI